MPDRVCAFAPARVNLIGEHTDYNQGLALPFAIELGVSVRARRHAGGRVAVNAVDIGEHDEFELPAPAPGTGWRAFVRGTALELRAIGIELPGAAIEITGSVPRGAGLASSAALTVGSCLALLELADAPSGDRLHLAELCSRVENIWVGARTGLLDQLAGLFAQANHALLIDFRTLELRSVPLALHGHRLVILDSGERHANAASAYNRRREECELAAATLRLTSLREATLRDASRLPEPLDRRARHVISENARVLAAADALEHGDLHRLGVLLDEAHASLRDDYEVSTPSLESAVDRLRQAGALGARMTGGGFGGHVLGLLPPEAKAPAGALKVTAGSAARVKG